MEYARWFSLERGKVLVRAPGGAVDTLQGPFRALVCMSSSYVGFLHAIGADSTIVGVSGLGFLGERPPLAVEVGYDAALDYEAIVRARPDLFLTYNVGAVEPPYLAKLRELGIRTVVLSEHLESHPLSRAEYVKLFGALTGRAAVADSVFCAVRDRYLSSVQPKATRKVLINIPYADQWFVPGADNYMTRLIRDAGGELLGAVPGSRNRPLSVWKRPINMRRRPMCGSIRAGAPPRSSYAASIRCSATFPYWINPYGTIPCSVLPAAEIAIGKRGRCGRISSWKTWLPSSREPL